ncbi:spore cortex-lytic enzyme [Pontibacillus yanchengensis]|uniref:Spore cortex-lytic enzyme n=2 Tax=Pontibacillus yanchengensis TaxID=462910 RepID=A0ACC7VK97_9BACI|nr:spore cortex-lytic enzyme [Pontibacillus yanchengensis]MYL32723.1 spore cortex-lytic enzyme [Pontibacillus yanchengensis]MYL55117.1 spore cortex-lytic enzyme [Pontibacillus yanchengensis]
MKLIRIISIVLLLVVLSISIPSSYMEETQAFSQRTLQKGATGDDVIELQARLQYIGFYNGNIDGVFGWGTYWALRNFQQDFGLKIDGLLGGETKQKLVAATKYDKQYVKQKIRSGKDFTYYGGVPKEIQTEDGGQPQTTNQGNQQKAEQGEQQAKEKSGATAVNIPSGYSQNDIQLMANAVHGEARGEPYVGQVAVAAVILNRVENASFPNSVSGVIFEPRAFTAVADGQIWLTPDEKSKEAVIDALNGWDPSGQAIYYFNPNTATSDWIWSRPQIKKIGKHIFAK